MAHDDIHAHPHLHPVQGHPFHLVNPSPWPILAAFSLLAVTMGAAFSFHGHAIGVPVLILGAVAVIVIAGLWWRDVRREAQVERAHTMPVRIGLRLGMGLFIVSEVMFFAAFFWAFFHASTNPHLPLEDVWAMGRGTWPPKGIEAFDPWSIPFLNTLILLLSGTTVTWAHYALLQNDRKGLVQGLTFTVVLGVIFSLLQAFEYVHASFGFKQGVYASTFYMATGFHGFHVIIGTIFLFVCLLRARRGDFTPEQHVGLEMAAWYWHFVDVVWLFLFICVYGGFVNKVMTAFGWM